MFDLIRELRELARAHVFPDLADRQHKALDRLEDLILPGPQPYFGRPRHPEWGRVREEWLKAQPACQACGGGRSLQVHHVVPFWKSPELELSRENLVTLCEAPYHHCHFVFGHLMNWASWNPSVREDAAEYLRKLRSRPGP